MKSFCLAFPNLIRALDVVRKMRLRYSFRRFIVLKLFSCIHTFNYNLMDSHLPTLQVNAVLNGTKSNVSSFWHFSLSACALGRSVFAISMNASCAILRSKFNPSGSSCFCSQMVLQLKSMNKAYYVMDYLLQGLHALLQKHYEQQNVT